MSETLKETITKIRKSYSSFNTRINKLKIGAKVMATGSSIHAGNKGTIVADYINMYLVEAADPSYDMASTNSIGEGKYFQIDARHIKAI